MQNFKIKTAEKILSAMKELSDSLTFTVEEIAEMLEYPPDSTMGDVAFPCFRLSKVLRNAPPKIAAALAEKTADFQYGTSAAVGGYLNFKIGDNYLCDSVLNTIETEGEQYGSSHIGDGKTVVLDYCSPNLMKPFHIGHLGTTVIGHSLKLLHEFVGYKCIGINYLGDWGTQFGKQIAAYKMWGDKAVIEEGGVDELVKLYVR